MKLNNKGFSLVEILGVMVILAIILTVAIGEYTKYLTNTTEKAYDILAANVETATEEYLMDHPTATKVTFDQLIEGGYIESIEDPGKDDENCEGKVFIKDSMLTEDNSLQEKRYTVSIGFYKYDYSYEKPGKIKTQDKYCKAHPYDITKITNIKVLNVYPYHKSTKIYGNHLKDWMNTYGKGIISVTPVYIEEFNKDPKKYLGEKGNWNYDEVVFGFVDCNGSQDLTAEAANLVDEYLSSGGAAIFGHDTLTKAGCGSHTNFNSLADHINMELKGIHTYPSGTSVEIVREGVFTEYPYKIGNIGSKLTIPKSHVYGQVAHGDVWITFDVTGDYVESDKIYLSTYGNNAFIQTGHSNGKATDDEQKIIANIIFYMVAKQYSEE